MTRFSGGFFLNRLVAGREVIKVPRRANDITHLPQMIQQRNLDYADLFTLNSQFPPSHALLTRTFFVGMLLRSVWSEVCPVSVPDVLIEVLLRGPLV